MSMANNYTRDGDKGLMDIQASLIPNPQTAKLMKPAYRSLYHPTKDAQATSMFSISAGNTGSDSNREKCFSVGIRIICAVSKQFIKAITGPTNLPFNRRNVVYQFQHLCDVMLVRRCGMSHNRNPLSVSQQMMLRTRFSPVYGARAGFFAPPTARIVALSTAHLVKSIPSTFRSWSRSVWWIVVHTPASCQSRSRRQQVMPDPHPISWGNISQGIPDINTKRIPVKQLRSSNAFLPGFLFRRVRAGMCGSIQFHNSSVSSGLAMITPPCKWLSSLHAAITIPFC